MARFKIGDSVQSDSTQEQGIIIEVCPHKPGKQMYKVCYANGFNKYSLESSLIPCTNLDDPFDCCEKGLFKSYSDFLCINTSYKIRNTSNNTISSLKASKTLFRAYQFKPLLKFLNSRNHRIIIADEVGLGKTIEAGHIMLELTARRELKNALIVCPKSLQEKWRVELKEKFGFDFTIYNIESLIKDLDTKDGFIRGIVNYEKLRLKNRNDLFESLDSSYRKFDFVLCDEAHRLRNRETFINKGISHLLENPCAAIFLTATPVMIKEENLYNLLNILDPQQYANYDVFNNSLAINAPFIRAISELNANVPFDVINTDLQESIVRTSYPIGSKDSQTFNEDSSTIKDRFKESLLFQRIITNLSSGDTSAETKSKIQLDLSAMSPMNNLFSRTRKKDITTDWTQAERDTYTEIVHLTDIEKEIFDREENTSIADFDFNYQDNDSKSNNKANLSIIQRKRQYSSSVFASLNEAENLKKGFDKYEQYEDAKISELEKIIKLIIADHRNHLIIFAIFKKTLWYLAIRLKKMGYNALIIHGDINLKERVEIIQKFKNAQSFTILLSSEVGSEGLDMQFCNAMVNYDLPWNPMIVEQRIGRIDRFGQKSPKVHIYNLIVEDSIQVDIYEKLLDRIGIFKNCIGDLEAILDNDLEKNGSPKIPIQEWFSKLEKELYCNFYTQEERREKIEAIAIAIQTERQNLEEVSEGLSNTLTNDIYFKNEIESINNHNRYVTEQEIFNYINLLIEKVLPSCKLEPLSTNKKIFFFKFPFAQPKLLINFLEEYRPLEIDKDLVMLNRQFLSRCRDISQIAMTFNQEIAYDNPDIEFISCYHPLVTSAYLYFEKNLSTIGSSFNYKLDKTEIEKSNKNVSNEYFMCLFALYAEKIMFGNTQKIERLIPVLYDAISGTIINDDKLIDTIYAFSQSSGEEYNRIAKPVDSDIILQMRISTEEKIMEIRKSFIEDQRILIESNKQMQLDQYNEYYKNQIESLQETLSRHQYSVDFGDEENKRNIAKIIPIDRHNIEAMRSDWDKVKDTINKTQIIEKEHKIISLSHIYLE